jgi:hypothetical protein
MKRGSRLKRNERLYLRGWRDGIGIGSEGECGSNIVVVDGGDELEARLDFGFV